MSTIFTMMSPPSRSSFLLSVAGIGGKPESGKEEIHTSLTLVPLTQGVEVAVASATSISSGSAALAQWLLGLRQYLFVFWPLDGSGLL